MLQLRRQSPIRFDAGPQQTVARDNWSVVLAYADEGDGPWITDLTHKTRWDYQNGRLSERVPGDFRVPSRPGRCLFADGVLVNRMNGTQASIYHLGPAAAALATPTDPGFTDVSEASVLLGIFGPNAFSVFEKLSNLDFAEPTRETPFLLQGPFCRVPCQVVVLVCTGDGAGGFLLSCSRGYGESMAQAILRAGREFGLQPAGEDRFTGFLETVNTTNPTGKDDATG